jgi:hypothetical protein
MNVKDHNKIVAIGFAFFAAIFTFTFLLLMLVSLGVFVALGITMANETGDNTQAGIGIAGGILSVLFYCGLAAVFVLPTTFASWKTYKRRRSARVWGTIAAILILTIMPLGTLLGIYALWFFFSAEGKHFYSSAE